MTQAVSIIQSYRCGFTAVLPNRIVWFGDAAGNVITANAVNTPMIGVSTEAGGDANQTMDVVIGGIAYVQMGQTMIIGNLVTSDGSGQGVPALTAGNRVIGVLLEPANTAGQICKIAVFPSVF